MLIAMVAGFGFGCIPGGVGGGAGSDAGVDVGERCPVIGVRCQGIGRPCIGHGPQCDRDDETCIPLTDIPVETWVDVGEDMAPVYWLFWADGMQYICNADYGRNPTVYESCDASQMRCDLTPPGVTTDEASGF